MSETSRGVARALAVLRTINAHPGASVSHIGQVAGISRPAVYRVVRTLEEAGYLRYDPASESLRLTPLVKQLSNGYDEEAWIMQDSDRPLIEISHALGFSDQSHFTRVFVDVMGETPRAFKRRLR